MKRQRLRCGVPDAGGRRIQLPRNADGEDRGRPSRRQVVLPVAPANKSRQRPRSIDAERRVSGVKGDRITPRSVICGDSGRRDEQRHQCGEGKEGDHDAAGLATGGRGRLIFISVFLIPSFDAGSSRRTAASGGIRFASMFHVPAAVDGFLPAARFWKSLQPNRLAEQKRSVLNIELAVPVQVRGGFLFVSGNSHSNRKPQAEGGVLNVHLAIAIEVARRERGTPRRGEERVDQDVVADRIPLPFRVALRVEGAGGIAPVVSPGIDSLAPLSLPPK